MAFNPASVADFSCSICLEIFKDPVFLSCSHSFCKVCIQTFWSQYEDRPCPLCKRRSSKGDPPINLVLKNLSELFLQERSHGEKLECESEPVCDLHNEKIKLFCLEDKQLACLVCRDSKIHINHNFRPISEAALDLKEDLKPKLKPLEEKLKVLHKEKQLREECLCHIISQAQNTQREIKKEFEKLHRFLQIEEDTRIIALKKEEQLKSQTMRMKIEEIDKCILYLTRSTEAIKAELKANDTAFLQNYRMILEKTKCNIRNPEPPCGALIDVAKHLGNLSFKVWEKMQNIVQYTPVILDPNASQANAIISEDLTSMRFSDDAQAIPDNPERFNFYHCALGSDAISSGVHCWDVDVKDNTHWYVGVLTESVQRKGEPVIEHGFWDFGFSNGKHMVDSSGKQIQLDLKNRKLERVRIYLDYNNGRLIFSDPLSDKQLHCLRLTLTERVFPYIWTRNTDKPLRVIPMNISINISM